MFSPFDTYPILFVGLGNPGEKYRFTRHNIGYRILDEWAKSMQWTFKEQPHLHSLAARGQIEGCPVHLLLPTAYMNNSGQAVRGYLDYFKLGTERLLILCDDVDLPFGKKRMRLKGGPGTHNGLKSVQSHLSTGNYPRLRIGIGKSPPEQLLADYVLENFSSAEEEQLKEIVGQVIGDLKLLIRTPMEQALATINSAMPQKN